MATYEAKVTWRLAEGDDFLGGRYSRAHDLAFDAGLVVAGSASAHVVGPRWSRPDAVDPEEAFVASLSACHMLWFLHKARDAGFVVAVYEDAAVGAMTPDADGQPWMSRVELRPVVRFAGAAPSPEALTALHHAAHEDCYIARSVRTEVVVRTEPAA